MSSTSQIKDRWRVFREQAREHESYGRIDASWACLEAAHILGQYLTRLHAASHLEMLGLAWRTRDVREILGQCARLLASILVTWIWVPSGNTGRSNVSAFKGASVPRDLDHGSSRAHR